MEHDIGACGRTHLEEDRRALGSLHCNPGAPVDAGKMRREEPEAQSGLVVIVGGGTGMYR